MGRDTLLLRRLGLWPLCCTVVTCLPEGNKFNLGAVAPGEELLLEGHPRIITLEQVNEIDPGTDRIPVLVDILRVTPHIRTHPSLTVRAFDAINKPDLVTTRLLFFVRSDRREEIMTSLCGMSGDRSIAPEVDLEESRMTTVLLPERQIVIARVGLMPLSAATRVA